jgi:tRNA modification GTPase
MSPINLSRLTPAGRGGVATLTLNGKNAKNAFLLRFISTSNLSSQNLSPSKPYFGKLRLDEIDQYEEIVARIINSDNVEIHCHGGTTIFAAIEKSFAQDGIQIKNIIADSKPISQRELALRLLPFATTERVAKILIEQYHGAMERELDEIKKLNEIIKQNATFNSTESNILNVTKNTPEIVNNEKKLEQLKSQLTKRQNRLEENKLIGRHLVKPFRVALCGDANVGKSSLFNAILGYNRAITSPLPGTTRDIVAAQTAINGFPVEIYDTAGIREINKNIDKNKIENEGIKRSIEQITDANLAIHVIDLTSENTNDNWTSRIIVTKNIDSKFIVTKNILTCYNKADLISDLPANTICVSAKTGFGIADLIEKIAKTLIPNPPQPFEAIPLEIS